MTCDEPTNAVSADGSTCEGGRSWTGLKYEAGYLDHSTGMLNFLADENREEGYTDLVCVRCALGDRSEVATFNINGVQGPCD